MTPPQLQRDDFRFILLRPGEKIPFEPGWQGQNNYAYDDERLKNHLAAGGNYGVVGGYGGLYVVDFDSQEAYNKVRTELPTTFKVLSGGKKLPHLYYLDPEGQPAPFKLLDENKDTILDVQGIGKQVVGPGSKLTNGGVYEIAEDMEITTYPISALKALFDAKLQTPRTTNHYPRTSQGYEDNARKVKDALNFKSVIATLGVDVSKNPTSCPLGHSSKGGKCFSWNDKEGLWKCFHCDEGGDLFTLYEKKKGVDFKTALKELAERAGVKLPSAKHRLQQAVKQTTDFKLMAAELYEDQPYFYDASRQWWLWNHEDRCWQRADDTDVLNAFDDSGVEENTVLKGFKEAILEAMRRYGRRKVPAETPKTWVQFRNLIVDVMTGETAKPGPEYFITNPLPWPLGDIEETPYIDDLLKQWVPETPLLLKDILVYCALPDYPIHRIFALVGGGSNGKSKYIDLLQRFVGKHNTTSIDMEQLINRPFEAAKLHKKLVALAGETNYSEVQRSAKLKELTGQDPVSVEKKNLQGYDIINYAKIVISTNSLPMTHDRSKGYYRRWTPIEFKQEFAEGPNPVDLIPDEEYANLCRFAVGALRRIITEAKLLQEGTYEARRESYENLSDPLQRFLKERVVERSDAFIHKYEFYERFAAWQRTFNYRLWGKRELSGHMGERFESMKKPNNEGINYAAWLGVGWRESPNAVDAVNAVSSILFPIYRERDRNNSISGTNGTNREEALRYIAKRQPISLKSIYEIYGNVLIDKLLQQGDIAEYETGLIRLGDS